MKVHCTHITNLLMFLSFHFQYSVYQFNTPTPLHIHRLHGVPVWNENLAVHISGSSEDPSWSEGSDAETQPCGTQSIRLLHHSTRFNKCLSNRIILWFRSATLVDRKDVWLREHSGFIGLKIELNAMDHKHMTIWARRPDRLPAKHRHPPCTSASASNQRAQNRSCVNKSNCENDARRPNLSHTGHYSLAPVW